MTKHLSKVTNPNERKRRVSEIGPTAIPIYSVNDWEPWPKGLDTEAYWNIVGPNVEMHIRRFPLWKVFVAVYLEGLLHGYQVANLEEPVVNDYQI